MASFEQIEQLRQEFTVEKFRFEQKLHESQKELYSLEIRNKDLNYKFEDVQKLLDNAENEKNNLINENKTVTEELKKLREEFSSRERSYQEEKEKKTTFINLTEQERNLLKDNVEQLSKLNLKYQKQVFDSQYELNNLKKKEFETKVLESLKLKLDSMENNMKELGKNNSKVLSTHVYSLTQQVNELTNELEKYKNKSSHYERVAEEQISIAQNATHEKEDKEQYYENLLKGVINEALSLKEECKLYQKEKEADKQMFEDMELEKTRLSRISVLATTAPVGAVELALQEKGRSIVDMYNEYTNLQDLLFHEKSKNSDLNDIITMLKYELDGYESNTEQNNVRFNQLLEENKIIKEQLKLNYSEISRLNSNIKNLETANLSLEDLITQRTQEIIQLKDKNKFINDKFNYFYEKKIDNKFLNEKLPEDPRKLHVLCFNLRTEKINLQRNNAALENHIESFKSQLSLRDVEDKTTAQHIHKLQERIQQFNRQIETLENERKQHLEIAFRNKKLKEENQELKDRNEHLLKELKNHEENGQLFIDEMNSFELYKSTCDNKIKNWEEQEWQDIKNILHQSRSFNSQLENQLTKLQEENRVLRTELSNTKSSLSIQETKWNELKISFSNEMMDLLSDSEKAVHLEKEFSSLVEQKKRLENELNQSNDSLISARTKNDLLQNQLNELNEKFSLSLKRKVEEHEKILNEKIGCQKEIKELSEKLKVNNAIIESQAKEIEKYSNQSTAIFDISEISEGQENRIIQLNKFYKELCDKYMVDLNKQQSLYDELKSATDIEREENSTKIINLQEEINQLTEKLTAISNELDENTNNLVVNDQAYKNTLITLNSQEQHLNEELKRLKHSYEVAQNNYNQTLIAHADNTKQLHKINDEYSKLKFEYNKLQNTLVQSESLWKNEKENVEKRSLELEKRFKELENENKSLHEHINNNSSSDSDHLISNLRQEREVFYRQAERYKVQFEQALKSLGEVRILLDKEREFNKKIQTESVGDLTEENTHLKILSESNKALREECENLEKTVNDLQSSKNEFEEKVSILKGQIQDLKFEKDNCVQEIEIIKKENEELHERFKVILEKYDIEDPTELQKLKSDLKSFESEIERLKAENAKYKRQSEQVETEKSRLTEENAKEKVRLNQEIQNLRNQLSYLQKNNQIKQAGQDKELEQLKRQLENSQQINSEITKKFNLTQQQKDDLTNELKVVKEQLDSIKEQMVETMRFKAQESMFISKVKKLEEQNNDLHQKLQQQQQSILEKSKSVETIQTQDKLTQTDEISTITIIPNTSENMTTTTPATSEHLIPSTSAFPVIAPREKPPVKLQRNRMQQIIQQEEKPKSSSSDQKNDDDESRLNDYIKKQMGKVHFPFFRKEMVDN
ncbi:3617_t:CDS:10 [Diversispora eburnea]|uniref:3617_t:CDS:1 n=1 Tax=Diversispora eburnea TaxID=1213867 RepID=A0A9N8VPQ8_9GLOM|nr:3617_t:CDS:10 [Diversispora eburnea]